MASHRRGFTLAEVAIATLILVVACLLVLMLLPGALKAQQRSRFHMLAALHAQNLLEGFYGHEMDLKGAYVTLTPRSATENANHEIGGNNFDRFNKPTDRVISTVLSKEMRLLGPLGNYDLEKVVGNRIGGNFPVPIAIARRLDSPGDEIRHILDNGGYVYYSDPINAGRLEGKVRESGQAVTQRGDMQRLIWGVVGHPQQNLLPYDPVAVPYSELYPFPPQARGKMIDRHYNGVFSTEWIEDGPVRIVTDTYNGVRLTSPLEVQRYREELTGTSFKAVDVEELWADFQWLHHDLVGYESAAWEWFGHSEPGSIWERGLPAYRRLVNQHWLRILHQIDFIKFSGSGGSNKPATSTETIPGVREETYIVTDAKGDVLRDAGGRPVTQTKQVATSITVEKANGVVVEFAGGGGGGGQGTGRGYPAPANGLGLSHLQGSDILEEDAAVHVQDLANQLRLGLPSLERRIMYRTAALRLWAIVYRGVDICQSGDPNIATDIGLLADVDNPLRPSFQMPSIADLHPTQILAASHLAHAAMMVTGYQPPFYDDNNSTNAFDDEMLLPTDGDDSTALDWEKHGEFGVVYEQLPYRAVEATCLDYRDPQDERPGKVEVLLDNGTLVEVAIGLDGRVQLDAIATQISPYLLDVNGKVAERQDNGAGPIGVETLQPRIIDPDEYTYLWNPYHPEVMTGGVALHRETAGPLGSTSVREQYQVAQGGQPLMYRRMAGGRINAFPPPYADRGAIDMAGVRRYRSRWQLAVEWDATRLIPTYRLLRKIVSGDEDPADGDTAMALAAHENALRLAMAWVSENPYDLTVPKPLNRQTFIDRGLYAFDLFDRAGRARRPEGLTREQRREAFYPISFPVASDRFFTAEFGVQNAPPLMVDSVQDWGEPRVGNTARGNWKIDQTNSLREQGLANRPFEFGRPYALADEGLTTSVHASQRWISNNPWFIQEFHRLWINRLHGFEPTDRTNQPLAAEPSHCFATKAWDPRDRTRQIVYWLVDWMQYEDAESAPSAPVDFSRLEQQGAKAINEIVIKKQEGSTMWDGSWIGDGPGAVPEYFDAVLPTGEVIKLRHPPGNSKIYRYQPESPSDTEIFNDYRRDWHPNAPPALRVENYQAAAEAQNDARFLAGNPESPFTWLDPERTATIHMAEDGALVASQTSTADGSGLWQGIAYLASGHTAVPARELIRYKGGLGAYDRKTAISMDVMQANPFWSLGTFGADRNGNGVFDAGPVPRSTRMQAVEIGRIDYYDPVSWLSLGR